MIDPIERAICTCYSVSEHSRSRASEYIAVHLEEVRVLHDLWAVEYRCPFYGKRWLADQPDHGTGPPNRLRTFEQVAREVSSALLSISALLPDDGIALRQSRELQQRMNALSFTSSTDTPDAAPSAES